MKPTLLPAGTYLIGDLCYTEDWDEMLSHPGAFGRLCAGKLEDGRDFWFSSTAYGDGCYSDQYGNEYWVDSGTIGCVRVADGHSEAGGMGRTFRMEQAFQCHYENGKIEINGVIIDTSPSEEEYEDDGMDA
mgnify:CR=1 FL=1